MKRVTLPTGELVPALGMGTWMLGEDHARRAEEIGTLQYGIDLGMGLIDTAEMYGEGDSEKLVGEAIRGRRERVFLVSKVYPQNAGRLGTPAACERSLKRLGVDCLDLYLLHWRGSVPLAETVEAFEKLKAQGKIRHWGVSNLDLDDLHELGALPGGRNVAVNQVLYNLPRRGIEWDLLSWCQAQRVPVMAYSPIEQSRLLHHRAFGELAARHGLSPAQLALAWLLRQELLIAIPKASTRQHLDENFSALQCELSPAILAELDRLFPPPKRASPLEML
ncbi:MAG: aldo/keto reductase [Betaproteobacteria bacterium]